MLRPLSFLAALLTGGGAVTGMARTFDYRAPPPPEPPIHGHPEPITLTMIAPGTNREPCPVGDEPAIGARQRLADRTSAGTKLPGRTRDIILCALIGADGRIAALTPAAGTAPALPGPGLARTLQRARFLPAFGDGRSVPAWHVLTITAGPLDTIPFTLGRMSVVPSRRSSPSAEIIFYPAIIE